MPDTRLGAWMSVPSAHDVDSRGWSRSPKGRSNASSVSLAALEEPTKYNTKPLPVFHGTATLQQTLSPRLMNRASYFSQEKELAETKTVCKSCT